MSGQLAMAFVRIRADTSLLKKDIAQGVKEGAAAGGAEGDAESAGSKAGKSYAKGFATAAKVGLAAVVAIGAASVDAAVKFQATMTRVQTQAGASASDVKTLTAQVLQLAPATQQGPEQLAEALYHLKSVGMDNVSAMKALKTASDLAAVGGANLEDTTNAIAAAWRSGIKGAQDFGQAAATVNAIIGAGNMTMTAFVGAMGTGLLSAATTFGVSLKQVGGALALMTDEGVPATDAATRLKMSFSLLAAPSQIAEKNLKQIGLTGLQLANTMRSSGGLVATIQLLKQHLDASGMSASQQAILLSHAFGGGRSSSAILTMMNNLSTLKLKQDQINEGIGKYGADVIKQRQTVQAQLDLLKSSFETLGVKIGTALLPPLNKFLQFLTSKVVPGVAKFAGDVTKILSKLGLGGGGKGNTPKPSLPGAPPVIGAGTGLANPYSSLLAGKPGKPGTLNAAQQYTAAIGTSLSHAATAAGAPPVLGAHGAGVTPAVQSAAKAYGQAAKTQASEAKKSSFSIGTSIAQGLVQQAGKIGAAILGMFKKVNWGSLGSQVGEQALPFVMGLTNGLISGVLNEAIHHPLDLALFIASFIPIGRAAGIIGKVLEHIPFARALVPLLHGLESAGKAVEKPVFGILKKIFGGIGGKLLGPLKDGLVNVGRFLLKEGGDLLLKLAAGAGRGWRAAAGWFKGVGGRVLSAVGKLAGKLLKPGIDLIKGLWDGAKGKWGDVVSWVKGIGGKVLAAIGNAAIWLVSKGKDAITGLLRGAENFWTGTLWPWVKSIPGKIKNLFADAGTWLIDAGKKIIGGLIHGITSMIGGIGHAIGSVVGHLKSFLPFSPAKQGPLSGKGDPYYSGVSIAKKLAAGIAATTSEVKKAIHGTAAAMAEALSDVTGQESAGTAQLASLKAHGQGNSAAAKKLKANLDALEKSAAKLQKAFDKASGAQAITAATNAVNAAIKSGNASQMSTALASALKQETSTTSRVAGLKSKNTVTAALRKNEESQIKQLIAARKREAHEGTAASKKLRAEQEKQIKSLEKLRAAQEKNIKGNNAISKELRKELDALKKSVTTLKKAIKKAGGSTSSSDSSDDSSDTSSSDTQAPPNWAAFNQWMTETGPVDVTGGSGGSSRPWAGNPGPFGGYGVGPGLALPRFPGRFDGEPIGAGANAELIRHNRMLIARVDQLIAVSKEQPARTAAGVNAAMNGVAARAQVRGGW